MMLGCRLSALRTGAYRRTRRTLKTVKARFAPKRAQNAYATHLPVLIGVAQLIRPQRAIEFGCGRYSTLTLLDRTCFPDLEQLDSYETDPEWRDSVAEVIGDDPRVSLRLVEKPVSAAVGSIAFAYYDLVFIDDSHSSAERAATIAEVARHCAPANVVIIHDYEIEAYRDASKPFRNRFCFTALNPNTGVVWNEVPIHRSELRRLNRLIRKHSRHLDPADIPGWVHVLRDSRG
jgi:predicted O-methyltransferase YrrM